MALLVAGLCFGPSVWFWDKHLWWGYMMAVVVGIPLYPIGIVGVGAVLLSYIRSN